MGQMIKFEHGMLVLNSLMTKEDVAAINEFAEYVRNQENERIAKLLLETPEGLDAMLAWIDHDDQGEALEALIKGENK